MKPGSAILAALLLAGCAGATRAAAPTPEPAFPTARQAPAMPPPVPSPGRPTLTIVAARALTAGGAPAGPTGVFDHLRDSRLFVVVPISGLAVGTAVAYVRYFDGRFLDSRSVQVSKPGSYLGFEMAARAGHTLVPATYRHQIYIGGRYAGATEFKIS